MTPRYVVVANPGSKRWDLYRRELLGFWAARGVAPEVECVPWAEVVPRDGNLDGLPAFDRAAIVRLESPGRDADVTRLLLDAGARDDPAEPPRDWRNLELPKGLLVRPGLQYRGLRRVLRGLRQAFDERPHLAPTACPLAVAEMFSKTATAAKLHAAGVPVPEWLPPADIPAGPLLLHRAIRRAGWATAYAKLNTGSSATGIMAGYYRPGEASWGLTTLAEVDGQFYNTRQVRRVTDLGMVRCLRFLLAEGVTVQRGVPKAQVDGHNFDLRVVCVYGHPAAAIFRLSPHPMTNLHLGGRRGDPARCRAAVPTREWLDALDHAADAAACFPSAVAGVDLAFEHGYRRHYVLEVNAFGDFFPGWVDDRGRSVHVIEVEATAGRHGLL